MSDDIYRLCECGSGKKFKFCCKDKVAADADADAIADTERGQCNLRDYEQELAAKGVTLP